MKDNSYLLFVSLLLLSISIFTQRTDTKHFFKNTFSKNIQAYITNAETDFEILLKNNLVIDALIANKQTNADVQNLIDSKSYIFLYKKIANQYLLQFWNTQAAIPDSNVLQLDSNKAFVQLQNGYFFIQKKSIENTVIINAVPIKWNYVIANDYLKNEFEIDAEVGKNFELETAKTATSIVTKEGDFLFSLKEKALNKNAGENRLTIWLRILSFIPLLLFIHFTAVHLVIRRGILRSAAFLIIVLFVLRLLTYIFAKSINMRQFELFDPSIYGSNVILRSLGDLLINVLLFLWIVNFIRNNIQTKDINFTVKKAIIKWLLHILFAFLLLFITYIGAAIIRSMVADSQISFDVMNFFSLNVYSFVGILILCSIAIGYYYCCSTILFFLQKIFYYRLWPFFLVTTVLGLFLLSFRVGNLQGGFELYELIWLLFFLILINNDLSGFFSASIIVSRMVFWLFFFCATMAIIIIIENNTKELRNKKHYAEVIATKNEAISDVLLNTILTEFRADVLATKFQLFEKANTSLLLRDSLVNNNFNSYTDNYETKVLVYDSLEKPLHNQDDITYTSINTILNTQAKPTAVADMYYFEVGADKFNYIAKRVIKNDDKSVSGFVFIIISPKSFVGEKLYPSLFSRRYNGTAENASQYAYAIYKNGKLILSHNDYAFSTRYTEKEFVGKQYLEEDIGIYNELWYNAGANKYVVVVKENKIMLELITLFSYLFCTFILLNAITSFITMLLRARFKWRNIKEAIRLSIRQQIHGTIISFSILSFIIIGIATILFFTNTYKNNNREMLSRTSKIIGTDIGNTTTKQMIENAVFTDTDNEPTELANTVDKLAKIHGQDINVYNLNGDLKASSIALPYKKGIVSAKINPLAFAHLNGGKEIQYYQQEQIGKLAFVSNYIPIKNTEGQEIAYLNVPYFTSQTKLKEEISTFLVTIIILNAFILLIAGIVALIITNKITHSFSFISDKMKAINLSKQNEIIVWNKKDEIGELVNEYNKMVSKLSQSAAALARTERENAWQEMAKQVAHEIKNPLTPMKLSMQFLQKAINENAPNIKELSAKVSATLVEQIDHLSNIAGEFSRFANIENAKPKLLNIKDAITSIMQLYQADDSIIFSCKYSLNDFFIFADKTHVNRILTNLVLNGIQSVAENKKPVITITEKIIDNTVEIEITDNGVGIPEAMQANIFMPNFTTKTSGTGLGLSMCKRMAEQAGGDLYFNTSSAGTSFYVSFPLVLQ